VVCRECGDELPPAFAGRPRSYCSVTCRQRAYRRRKADAAATKALEEQTETTERTGEASGRARGDGAQHIRSTSAEAIMIRVRLDDELCGDAVRMAAAGEGANAEGGWAALDDLVRAALLLAQRLGTRGSEPEEREEPEG
jgi:hypothetical protein